MAGTTVKVDGMERVVRALKKMEKDIGGSGAVYVGYTANYALYVHENTQANFRTGQAKFLEQPFRTMQKELYSMIVTAVRKGVALSQALVLAGLRLQRESQLLCPVRTGNLRGSAFTRLIESEGSGGVAA